MVTPNRKKDADPPLYPPTGKEQFKELFGQLLAGLSQEFGAKDTLPKDDPAYLAKYSNNAALCAQYLANQKSCPCPRCKLSMFETAISEYVCTQTVAAALTGDTSKLQGILDLIAAQKEGK